MSGVFGNGIIGTNVAQVTPTASVPVLTPSYQVSKSMIYVQAGSNLNQGATFNVLESGTTTTGTNYTHYVTGTNPVIDTGEFFWAVAVNTTDLPLTP